MYLEQGPYQMDLERVRDGSTGWSFDRRERAAVGTLVPEAKTDAAPGDPAGPPDGRSIVIGTGRFA